MGKILEILVVTLFITKLNGFPQKSSHKPQISNFPAQHVPQKQDHVLQSSHHDRRTRNVDQKPIDRSQISTFPATVDSHHGEDQTPLDRSQIRTLPAYINFENAPSDTNRKVRDTVEEIKPLDRSQISTLPGTQIKHSSEETNDRKVRDTESDESSEERSNERIKPAPAYTKQTNQQSRDDENSSEEDGRDVRAAEDEKNNGH